MTRPWLVAALLTLACRGPNEPASLPPAVRSLVRVGRDFTDTTPAEVAWSEAELARIAREARASIRQHPERTPSSVLGEVVFGRFGFTREVDDTDVKFVLLPSVLRSRRGSCVGLGTLYLALGQVLDLRIEGVMRPGHFFVRFRDGEQAHNVELLHAGEEMPDLWYQSRFPIPGGAAPEYARALSLAEVRGIVEYDIGNEKRRNGRLYEAREAYARAAKDFPELAEAHASLAATLHLLGALDAAEESYRTARGVNPSLPGIDGNLDLLERERDGAH